VGFFARLIQRPRSNRQEREQAPVPQLPQENIVRAAEDNQAIEQQLEQAEAAAQEHAAQAAAAQAEFNENLDRVVSENSEQFLADIEQIGGQ
jgi:hypothetical protein